MKIKITKWGACLGIRIPMGFAREMQLNAGDEVDIRIENGKLTVAPIADVDLETLLAGVTEENRHGEVNWGADRGKEIR